jgi:hypothetical protein
MGEPARVLEFKKKPAAFGDMLKKTATVKEPAKTKSKMPVLDAPEHVRQAVDEYIDAKTKEVVAKAEKEAAETVVLQFTGDVQDEDGYKGKFQTSYAVPGNKPGNQVKYISSNRFSINGNDKDKLEEMLGDQYPEMVQEEYTVKLRLEVFEKEELQAELMELVGDRFEEFFETILSLKVKEDFNKNLYRVVDKGGLPELRTFCKPYKAALR